MQIDMIWDDLRAVADDPVTVEELCRPMFSCAWPD